MSISFVVGDNKLNVEGVELTFKNTIRYAKELDDVIIVLIQIPNNSTELDNVYGVSKKGEIIWQIQSVDSLFSIKNPLPYENLFVNENTVSVSDFYGRRYIIDPADGKILGKNIAK